MAIFNDAPINQQNALPTLNTGASSGTGSIIGGTVIRKWTAAQVGIDGVATTTDANGHVYCVSNFLNVTGCRSFATLLLRSSSSGALIATPPGMLLMWQMRVDAADIPPTSLPGVGINLEFCGMSGINTGGAISWPAMGSAAEVQRHLLAWDFTNQLSAGVAGATGSMSNDVRFFLSFSASAVGANNRFSMILWGSG